MRSSRLFFLHLVLVIVSMTLTWACARIKKNNSIVAAPIEQKALPFSIEDMGPSKTMDAEFENKSLEYGPIDLAITSMVWADLNGDSFDDFFAIENNISRPYLYYFDPSKKKFVNQNNILIDVPRPCSQVYLAHLNSDDQLDLICFRAATSRGNNFNDRGDVTVYLKKGNEWKVLEKALALGENFFSTLKIADFNLDGHLDFFLGSFSRTVPSQMYWGNGDGTFMLASDLNFEPSFISSANICDINNDGFPDLLLTSLGGRANQLLVWNRNLNNYQDFGRETGFAADPIGDPNVGEGGKSLSSSCSDYNQDGIWDLAVGESRLRLDSENADSSSVLTGSSRLFPFRFVRTPIEDEFGKIDRNYNHQKVFFTYVNDDYLPDLVVEDFGHPPDSRLRVMIQQEDHSYKDEAGYLGLDIVNPIASQFKDLNGDGQLDLILGQGSQRTPFSGRTYVFERRHSLDNKTTKLFQINLVSKYSNRGAIGAIVTMNLVFNSKGREQEISIKNMIDLEHRNKLLIPVPQNAFLKSFKVKWPHVMPNGSVFEKEYKINKRFPMKSVSLTENGHWSISR